MTISFEIPLIPTAQMRARSAVINGHATTYKHSKQRRNENQIMQLIADKRPDKPIDGAVLLQVVAYLPIPTSWPVWKREAAHDGTIMPTGKPDLDNLVKNIKDCMTQCGYWTDDSRVVDCVSSKCYSERPRWFVSVAATDQPKTKAEYEAMIEGVTI